MEFYESSCKKLTCFSNVSRSAAGGMDTDRTACRFCCLPDQRHFPFYQNSCPLLFCGLHRSDFRILWRYLLSVSKNFASQRILYKCTITTRNPKGSLSCLFYDPDGILTRSFCPSFSTIVSTGICFFLSACTTGYPANI